MAGFRGWRQSQCQRHGRHPGTRVPNGRTSSLPRCDRQWLPCPPTERPGCWAVEHEHRRQSSQLLFMEGACLLLHVLREQTAAGQKLTKIRRQPVLDERLDGLGPCLLLEVHTVGVVLVATLPIL